MRHTNNTMSALLFRACLSGASLCFPCVATGSSSVDICQEPASEPQLAIAYYDHGRSSFERSLGTTNRAQYSTDLQLDLNDQWTLGFGHRSTILNVDNLVLQTNGYLHTFFLPMHRTAHGERGSFRLSISPALSASSNVTKDPGEYSEDAFQLLAALVWSRPISGQLSWNYGVCGDHRLGGFQVYPVIGFDWRPGPAWRIEFGFPTSRLSYQFTKTIKFMLRASPDGSEWYVKSKNLEMGSRFVYEAYLIESAFRWRPHHRIELAASVGREINPRYTMTLFDNSRVRLSSESATRVGLAFAWYF